MKNIRLFELESDYHNDKTNHEYPTVSYTKDTDKVWYVQKETIPFEISEWFIESVSREDFNCGNYYDVKYSNLFDFVTAYYEKHKYYDEDMNDYRCDGAEFTLYGEQIQTIRCNEDRIQMYINGMIAHSVYIYLDSPNAIEVGCPVE